MKPPPERSGRGRASLTAIVRPPNSVEFSWSAAAINDPVRAAAYAELGIATICRTTMLTDAILGHLGLRPTGMPSVISAVPHVHDEEAEASRGMAGGAGAEPGEATAQASATTDRRD